MTKNLETADKIVKLTSAIFTLILYFTGVIDGPLARILMLLSLLIIIIYLAKSALAVKRTK